MLAFGIRRGGLGPATSADRDGDEKLYIFVRETLGGCDVLWGFVRLELFGLCGLVPTVSEAIRISGLGDEEEDSIMRCRFLLVGV
jgi:hypothetical protein